MKCRSSSPVTLGVSDCRHRQRLRRVARTCYPVGDCSRTQCRTLTGFSNLDQPLDRQWGMLAPATLTAESLGPGPKTGESELLSC